MGLVFGTFRRLRLLAQINDMPLPRVYWYMRRTSIVYVLYATLYLIIGIANVVQDVTSYTHTIGVLYLISAGFAALAGEQPLLLYRAHSIVFRCGRDTLFLVFSVDNWEINIFSSYLRGYNDVILAIYIIPLLIAFSGVSSLYIHYVIIKRLRAGEKPDLVEGSGRGGLRDDLIPAAQARSTPTSRRRYKPRLCPLKPRLCPLPIKCSCNFFHLERFHKVFK